MAGEDKRRGAAAHLLRALPEQLHSALQGLDIRRQRVLVAVSAGLDSTALARLLAARAGALEIELCLGHVHHGLRGSEADGDLAFVEKLGGELGVPCAARRVDVAARRAGSGSRDRPSVQEAARDLRRAALIDIARERGCDVIATAHHADDQAETLLMRILRGTGPDGLAGIAPRSRDGWFVRPLLGVARETLEAWAAEIGLDWREDRSNASDDYLRNRIRRHWLPALTEEFNPKLLRALADLAEAQLRDAEWIEGLVALEADARFATEGAWLRIDTRDWERLPQALARRLVRSALVRCGAGRHVSRRHLERMLDFLARGRIGGAIELPGSLLLVRARDGFRLGPQQAS